MASLEQERASWDGEKDAFLVQSMTEQAQAGKRADSGFKKEAWAEALVAFNARFKTKLTRQQLKSRLALVFQLKGNYTAIKTMLDASGFGWDDDRHAVLVHDSVWNDYIEHHPKVTDYRKKPMPLYEDLGVLLEGTYATGEYALASDEPCPADYVSEPPAPPPSQSPTPSEHGADDGAPRLGTTETTPQPLPEPVAEPAAGSSTAAWGKSTSATTSKKRRSESGGVLIAEAISDIASEMCNRTAKIRALSPSQRAIKLLQKEYANELQTESLVQAFDVMLDEKKAMGFLVMEAGPARDAWLSKQIDPGDEV